MTHLLLQYHQLPHQLQQQWNLWVQQHGIPTFLCQVIIQVFFHSFFFSSFFFTFLCTLCTRLLHCYTCSTIHADSVMQFQHPRILLLLTFSSLPHSLDCVMYIDLSHAETFEYLAWQLILCNINALTFSTECNGSTYNPETHKCCVKSLRERPVGVDESFLECCGDFIFDNRPLICCGGDLYVRPSESWKCCRDTPFDRDIHMCCQGEINDRLHEDYKCCAKASFDPLHFFCRDGELFPHNNPWRR